MQKDMDLTQAYYESKFENLFLSAKGNEFQSLFEKLMGLAYMEDFMACRPWGNHGDRKNDGFLKSERKLFQVYAPYEMTANDAISKITQDFDGAKEHWGKYFDQWVFVHNAKAGLPPHIHRFILEFEENNHGIEIKLWSLEELKVIFRRLKTIDLQSWFGPALTLEVVANLGFDDLRPILEHIASRPVPPAHPIHDVPRGKIESNALSENVALLLKSGMSKAPLIESFFSQWHDETLGERIGEAFRNEYQQLKDAKKTPNEIFSCFQSWAGGALRGTSEHEVAILVVIAYYFERCDIFEEPREEQP